MLMKRADRLQTETKHYNTLLYSKTQKPFFILKESSKCHNINYQAEELIFSSVIYVIALTALF